MREAVPRFAPARRAGADPRAPGLPVRRSAGAADVRRADGASARAGDGRVLPQHGRGHAEHHARAARALPRHARRAERDDRAARRAATQYDFDGFMERYGDLFPDNPRTLDELLENMARRMAAMCRLMASLSPEQRAELQALAEQVMQDMDLAFEVDRLGANLPGRVPGHAVGRAGDGRTARSRCRCRPRSTRWSACTTTRSSTARCEGDYPGAALEDVDEDALRRTLGEPAVRDLRRLKEIERALEKAGLVHRQQRPAGGHAAGRAQAGRARAGPGVRGAPARSRGHARGARRRRPGRADRRDPAVAVRRHGPDRRAADRVQRGACAREPGEPRPPASGRLRAGRGRAAHRDRHRAPARPVVLDAAARPLRAREEDGARAARADRGPLPARHALPDRVQRLRAPAAARGPHGARVRARVRHEHAARVPAGRTAARRSTRAPRAR